MARQSENVGSDFLYQAAPSTDSFPVFAASSEAHRVTSENSPNKSGVVRWIAKSDLRMETIFRNWHGDVSGREAMLI